jgi:primosomal protein N' (replication factor Y) (superfamily II helicase)
VYCEVIFFLSFKSSFTYAVPADLQSSIKFGVRVLAPFGKRTLTGLCVKTKKTLSGVEAEKVKEIFDVVDEAPILSKKDFELYEWMAEYYLCSTGEIIRNATPHGTDIQSIRRITSDTAYCAQLLLAEKSSSTKGKLLTVLSERDNITLKQLQKTVKKKNIYGLLRSLQLEGAVTIVDELSKAKVREKTQRYVKLKYSVEDVYNIIPEIERRSPKQVVVLLKMIEYRQAGISLNKLLDETKVNAGSVASLAKKGILALYQRSVERKYRETYENDIPDFKLTDEQNKVYESVLSAIEQNIFKTFLLYGVTGSGKTFVYLELAKKVIAAGKSVLVMVPEISLTPQITSRFVHIFKDNVVVLHSRVSPGERFDAWNKVVQGRAKIVIGARSALFAPLQNIGLIVVDEEHDASYKQNDTVPKYNARDAAVVKGKIYNAPVLLGSATPCVESMFNAQQGKYELLELRERVDDARMPEIRLVNIIEEKKQKRMFNVFSKTMLDMIDDRLKKKEGTIILQNRRGFSTSVYCFDCGEIEMCENCSVALVHHINQHQLQCHYCGFTKPVPKQCTKCGSFSIKYFGTGTERVEDELSFYFPEAVLNRVDSDAIAKKGSLGNILNNFRNGQIDILIGTQMVAKGLDFPRVTLVCVVSAETNLWMPDFRADERTFQLLTQVAGRAGRAAATGEVLIQTQNDKSPVLHKVIENDYIGFFNRELANRGRLLYPPFAKICLIEAKDLDEHKAKGAITDIYAELHKIKKSLIISPPTTAILARLKNEYRYQIMIKSPRTTDPSGSVMRSAVAESMKKFQSKSKFKDVRVLFDVDPQTIM